MTTRLHNFSGFNPLQAAFDFVAHEDQEKMTGVWESHFNLQELKRVKKDNKKRKIILAKIQANQTLDFNWSQYASLLDAPLGAYEPSELDVQPLTGEDASPLRGIDIPANYDWTDDDIRDVHHGLLLYRLKLLRSRGNGSEKAEALTWIFAHDVFCIEKRIHGGKLINQPIRMDQIPFTFQTCCRLNGYDYETVRETVEWMLRPFLKKIGFPTR